MPLSGTYPFYTRHPLSTPSPPLLSAHVTRTLGGRRHLTFLLGIDEACRLEVTTHHRSAVVLIISCSDSIALSATRFTFGWKKVKASLNMYYFQLDDNWYSCLFSFPCTSFLVFLTRQIVAFCKFFFMFFLLKSKYLLLLPSTYYSFYNGILYFSLLFPVLHNCLQKFLQYLNRVRSPPYV